MALIGSAIVFFCCRYLIFGQYSYIDFNWVEFSSAFMRLDPIPNNNSILEWHRLRAHDTFKTKTDHSLVTHTRSERRKLWSWAHNHNWLGCRTDVFCFYTIHSSHFPQYTTFHVFSRWNRTFVTLITLHTTHITLQSETQGNISIQRYTSGTVDKSPEDR